MLGAFTPGRDKSQGVLAVSNANALHGVRPTGRSLRTTQAAVAAAILSNLTGLVQAQTSTDTSLTLHGITLYGLVDIGLQYETHGATLSDFFPAGGNGLIQKNSYKSVVGGTPNNFSQSRLGLQGKEPLVADWSGVFRVETFFNPQSGNLSDGLKSLTLNNGKALTAQSTGVDTSVAGQLFTIAYAGVSSPTYGTITFGRQLALMADGIGKYDPLAASQAFSVIGYSGTAAGAGDTEDRRLDQSLKYFNTYHGVHLGAQYRFNGSNGASATAWELQLGVEQGGASVDAFAAKVRDAVAASSLSAAQVAELPTLGYSSSNSLAATISDNTMFSLMGSYALGTATVFAGYEHIKYANPTTPLQAGYLDEGGYILAFVNNAAYTRNKNLQVYWTGVKYTIRALDLYAAYYGYHQANFATGTLAGCSSAASAACSGELVAFSLAADYRIAKRFDCYFGAMWSGVQNGLANGYLTRNSIDPTLGVRFRF
jgi:predicted porin